MANFKYGLGDEKKETFPIYFGAFVIVLLVALFAIVWAVDVNLPSPINVEDVGDKSSSFIAAKAQDHLRGLTDIGPRLVGSDQNEISAVTYLKSRIDGILSECNNPNIKTDYQVMSGAFYLNYQPYGSINAYSNLQNVIVRIPSSEPTNEAILINSHFDTMPNSPGGSDDGIMCAVMLEVLRHVCKEESKSNLIFLFNGAEESYLQGSHAFISNPNKWMDSVKLVINLEATGAGGKELLFQDGPKQNWLLEYYSQVPHPHAQAVGSEIFENNLIPSDTDFRIFREFGNTIGYDMAYTRNGYRYHSENDGFSNIPLGTFQHTGDNVLALVRALSNAPYIGVEEPRKYTVFYDMFGLFLVYYDETIAVAVNSVAIVLSIFSGILGFYRAQLKFSLRGLKCLIVNILGIILSWLVALALVLAIGAILDVVNKTMSWYRFPFFVAGLYLIPIILSMCVFTMLLYRYNRHRNSNNDILIHIHINRLIWTILLIVGTACGIRSSYLLIYPIYFTSTAHLIINIFSLQIFKKTWQIIYVVSTIIPTLFSFQIVLEVYGLFIPISGRSGGDSNPEFTIGLFTWLMAVFILSFYVPIICVARLLKYLLIFLCGTCIIFIIVAATAFIPYDEDASTPVLQRYWMFHTSRTIRGDQNDIIKQDYGFTFENMDRNSPNILQDYIGDYLDRAESLIGDCESTLYCGLPVLYTESYENIEKFVWIPTSGGPEVTKPTLILRSKLEVTERDEALMRYCFEAKGTDHYNVYFSPREKHGLRKIDLLDFVPTNQPLWKGRDTYFILYVDGKERKNLEFCIDLVASKEGANLDIAIAGTYYDEKVVPKSDEYQAFLNKFPHWTSINAWSGTYESWVF